ncbi:alpha-L-rhamnosidase C-terminal domain-containing protein [Paenarthrobacter aurescens]|uniref:alpha-L-rhamnosidase C-terminal domain-containing protein n=1 Tax=Paenarthrobacter aurescens TaxID=43663 RepID=UPI0014768504|nr:hypothetical protein [Paenarthrobacter aurescens]MDO6147295.1 hypothetical protein [Paenarthrobacter aurescens]MDO6158539.1 hypothetical protein [Paenarthrobacter aurescens]MDO6162522.1 hypothetical protein [Paenarthrobacter aurescens]
MEGAPLSGLFDQIHGRISSAWTLDRGQFILRLDIPEGVSAGGRNAGRNTLRGSGRGA